MFKRALKLKQLVSRRSAAACTERWLSIYPRIFRSRANWIERNNNVNDPNVRTLATIAVGMSGGIDSTVAAMMLKDQGHEVIGVFMRNWDSSDELDEDHCSLSKDREDMFQACDRLKIPAFEVELVKDYWNEVFTPFLSDYSTGVLTPNPDVACNRYIKFNALKSYVKKRWDIDHIATGHYAQLNDDESDTVSTSPSASTSTRRLFRARDLSKDQSYFLSMTPGEKFDNVHFPLGGLLKSEVREIANRDPRLSGLRVLTKKESMGICFVGKRPLDQFLNSYIGLTPGNFVDLDTRKVLCRHKGKELYTVGQGANIAGVPENKDRTDPKPTMPRGKPKVPDSDTKRQERERRLAVLTERRARKRMRKGQKQQRVGDEDRNRDESGDENEIEEKRRDRDIYFKLKGENRYYVAGRVEDSPDVYVVLGRDNPALYSHGIRLLTDKHSQGGKQDRKEVKVTVCSGAIDNAESTRSRLSPGARRFSWISGSPPEELLKVGYFDCFIMVRYKVDLAPCRVWADQMIGEIDRITFSDPKGLRIVAPGQVAALYREVAVEGKKKAIDNDLDGCLDSGPAEGNHIRSTSSDMRMECLGGGIIGSTF